MRVVEKNPRAARGIPYLHLSSDSYPGRSDLSHSVSTAVSAEAEPQADNLGDDSDGTEIAGDSSNGSRAAHGPSTTSVQALGQQFVHLGPPQTPQTQVQQPQPQQQNMQVHWQIQRAEDIGAQDAFIAGMIYTLSKRLLPGAPYAPGQSGSGTAGQTFSASEFQGTTKVQVWNSARHTEGLNTLVGTMSGHRKACASKGLGHSCMWGDERAHGIGGACGTVAALYSKPECDCHHNALAESQRQV